MKLRQEQIVFLAAAALFGFLAWRLFSAPGTSLRGSGGGGEALELARFPVPDVARVLPPGAEHAGLARDLLSPPRDTRPLPPLELVEPPREPLQALFPPSDPGPRPSVFHKLLRLRPRFGLSTDEAAELFAATAGEPEEPEPEGAEALAGEEQEPRIGDLLAAAGDAAESRVGLTPAESQQLAASYKRQYDWFFDDVQLTFGRIENPERYGLKTDRERASEPLQFVEILPEKGGAERFPGMAPVAIPRERAKDWGFADTFANKIEVRRGELGDAIARSTYTTAMTLADECVRGRLEAPRALEIAEELYRMCAAFDAADAAPRLGLARCYEAGFRFEQAFEAYTALVADFAAHAEVHARLGLLEARFFLWEEAEERLQQAVRLDRNSWEARAALGRFLLERGRAAEALEHLDAADRAIPNDPSTLAERVAVRVDLASARLASGDAAESHALYGRTLTIDPDQERARAGYLATALFLPSDGSNGAAAPPAGGTGEPGFELLLARGLAAIARGDAALAKQELDAAASADPLRAHVALRALSYLAGELGLPGEALRYVEEALECDPTDPYSLYQAGRLYAREEDGAAARAALLAALEQDLGFVDALALLGETAFRMGAFDDAERYLERALALEPANAAILGLRGLNHLQRRSAPDARVAFEAGRALAPDDALCRAGLAWCTYLSGDAEQALVALRELDDSLRALPETDPMRQWARAQIERIQDHARKVEWSDGFERKEVKNGWDAHEGAGPVYRIVDGELVLEGSFSKTGMVLLYRTKAASLFDAVEADVWVDASSASDVGLFLAREQTRARTGMEILERVAVVRHLDGRLQVNLQKEGNPPKFVDMQEPFPTGRWVRLRLERAGDETDTRVTVYADGVPLVENAPMATLRASTPLLVGFMAEGEPGRAISARFDNFQFVYRENL